MADWDCRALLVMMIGWAPSQLTPPCDDEEADFTIIFTHQGCAEKLGRPPSFQYILHAYAQEVQECRVYLTVHILNCFGFNTHPTTLHPPKMALRHVNQGCFALTENTAYSRR